MRKLIDITGQQFGEWTVLSYAGNKKWLCKCSCGATKEVLGRSLRNGETKSCGCASSITVDIIGQRFGKLVAIRQSKERRNGRVSFLCRCDCGNEKIFSSNVLRRGEAKSCGCLVHSQPSATFIDLAGRRFGRLTVISRAENKGRATMWTCRCDCGAIKVCSGSNLKLGKIISCGCFKNEQTSTLNKSHGLRHTRLYGVWLNIKNRCNNTKDENYLNYGARGIKICEEWSNNFIAFYAWAYANGYDENAPHGECTIDRINNDGNYEPNNCRWVDLKTQANNRRKRRWAVKPKELSANLCSASTE